MRVLFYSRVLGSTTETFVFNTLTGLSDVENIEVLVVTNRYDNRELFPFNKVRVIELSGKSLQKRLFWKLYKAKLLLYRKDKNFAVELSEVISNFQPDVIHCNFGYDGLLLFDSLKKKYKINREIFFHFHGYDASSLLINSPAYKRRIKRLVNNNRIHAICVSNNMFDELYKMNIRPDKRRILYCGVDLSLFHRTKLNSSHKVFLQVSSFREKKGHQYTLEAFFRFLEIRDDAKNYLLVLAGGGDMYEEIYERALRSEYSNQVIFTGWIDRCKAVKLMDEADFFLHHSVTAEDGDKEGIPTAIMEAMAMQLPVISTKHSGIHELVEDGINGYLIEERDVNSYVKRLEDILEWDYCMQNRQKIVDVFGKDKHTDSLVRLYNEAISTQKTP